MDRKRAEEIQEKLLRQRIVFIGTPIDDSVATMVESQLTRLKSEGSGPISVYINSPGGSVSASFAILDALQSTGVTIGTVCIRESFGTATLILASGTPGFRRALPNARIGIGDVWGGSDGEREVRAHLRTEFFLRWATATGRPVVGLEAPFEDRQMTPEEAVREGVVDRIVRDMEG